MPAPADPEAVPISEPVSRANPPLGSRPALGVGLIDRLSGFVREGAISPFVYRVVWLTRLLLAAGFVPTGAVKLLGKPFTRMSIETPIGDFFDAMHRTGGYWRFLGLMQVLSGVLVLLPASAHLGAAVYWAIILNIAVITLAIGFGLTSLLTFMMLCAVTLLIIWDWHRFRPLVSMRGTLAAPRAHRLEAIERFAFGGFGLGCMLFFLWTRDLVPAAVGRGALVLAVIAGVVAFARSVWVMARRGQPYGMRAAPPPDA